MEGEIFIAKIKWNIETMNEYSKKIGYSVLEIKWIEKPYQKQLWALVKCPNLNHKPYWAWWNNILKGYLCKLCHYEQNNMIMWTYKLVEQFYESFGVKLLNINEFKNIDEPMTYIDNYGFKYRSSITGLRQYGTSSFKFYLKNPFALENIDLFCKLFRPEYELLTREYTGIKAKYMWRYNGDFYSNKDFVLNREFEVTADSFINGMEKHPNLTLSKLSLGVIRVLEKYDIKYEREKTFSDCRDKGLLRFDFYIDTSKNNFDYSYKEICIEADGWQHEIPVAIWDNEIRNLDDRVKKDNIKNDYCRRNDISLIRIPQKDILKIEIIICSLFNIEIDSSSYIIGTNKTEIIKLKAAKDKEKRILKQKSIVPKIKQKANVEQKNFNPKVTDATHNTNVLNVNNDFNNIINDWNKGKFVRDLCKIYGLSDGTIRRYLQIGESNNLCKYKADFAPSKKSIVCITTGEIFNSLQEAIKYSSAGNICACLKGRRTHAGKLSDGTRLKWDYYIPQSLPSPTTNALEVIPSV